MAKLAASIFRTKLIVAMASKHGSYMRNYGIANQLTNTVDKIIYIIDSTLHGKKFRTHKCNYNALNDKCLTAS